jgi:adenosylcobinamide-GDP ribazoletransferase
MLRKAEYMSFLAALRFLTVIPVPAPVVDGPKTIGRSMAFFPLVGLLLGIILAGLHYLLRLALPAQVTSALLVLALAVLTGGHHLDGLIDTFDATVSGRTRPQRLAIMSDARVGSFGITALCLALLLKYSALIEVGETAMLAIFPAVSRWTLCSAILIFPAAKDHGAGFAVKQSANRIGLALATVITVLIVIVCAGLMRGSIILITALVIVCCAGLAMKRLFGGLTGDSYGALVEIGEVITLLLALALTRFPLQIPGYDLLRLPLPG